MVDLAAPGPAARPDRYLAVNGFVGALLFAVTALAGGLLALIDAAALSTAWKLGIGLAMIVFLIGWAILAILAAPGEDGNSVVGNTLEAASRPTAYQRLVQPVLNTSGRWLEISADAPWLRLLSRSLSRKLLDVSLTAGVAYPLILVLLSWAVSGADARLGSIVILQAQTSPWLRAGAVSALSLASVLLVLSQREIDTEEAPSPFGVLVIALTILGGVILGLAAPGALALALAGAVAGAVILFSAFTVFSWLLSIGLKASVALPELVTMSAAIFVSALGNGLAPGLAVFGAISGSVALAWGIGSLPVTFVAILGGLLGAGALVSAVAILRDRDPSWIGSGFLLLGLSATVMIAVWLVDWSKVPEDARGLVVFLAVLPLINGVYDWLSLGVTLALVRLGQRSGVSAVLFGLLDALFAAGLFLASGATMIAAIHGMNLAAGVAFVPLGAMLAEMGDVATYWWVYAMLFSTALPTLLHLFLAALSVTTPRLPPGLRAGLRRLVAAARTEIWAMAAAPLALTAVAVAGLAVIGLGLALAGYAVIAAVDLAAGWEVAVGEQVLAALEGYLGLLRQFADVLGVPHFVGDTTYDPVVPAATPGAVR